MSRLIRFALFFVTFAFSHCLHGFAQDELSEVKVDEKLQPVRISASETTLAASGKSALTPVSYTHLTLPTIYSV